MKERNDEQTIVHFCRERERTISTLGTSPTEPGIPKRIMFGNLEGAVRRGRGGKEKEWTDCVQSDIRAFGITGDWETMAVMAKVWVEAVTKGGRRFMAAWREEEEDAARHRQEKREATRLGKLQSHTEA